MCGQFQNGEMYAVQQVRLIGRSGETRRTLHPTVKRGEREDLCLSLVLVRHPRLPHLYHAYLPYCHHFLAPHARLHDANAFPARSTRQRRHHRATEQDGRLVSSLHSRGESRLGHIPGHYARVCEQVKSQLSASHTRHAGRVTSNPGVGVPHVTDGLAARHGPARLSCPVRRSENSVY